MNIIDTVRDGDHRLKFSQIVRVNSLILGVRIACEQPYRLASAGFDIVNRYFVRLKQTCLGSGFDGHISKNNPIINGHVFHCRATEFHDFIVGAVSANIAKNLQDQITGSHARLEFTMEIKAQRFRHHEPNFA